MHSKLLTKYYFINTFDTNNLQKQDKETIIIYRNYTSTNINILKLLKLKNFLRKKGNKFFMANNFKLALKLRLDGVYIPSFNNKFSHLAYSTFSNFSIIGSAHNLKEILIKKKQKCDEVFLSPLFKVDKSKKFLNVSKFNLIAINSKTSCIALGGINQSNYKKIKLLKSRGFATISWAKKNGLSELRPF